MVADTWRAAAPSDAPVAWQRRSHETNGYCRSPVDRTKREMTVRLVAYSLLALLVPTLATPAGHAGELRIAAWNLEHLDDADGAGCVGRNSSDYSALTRQIEELEHEAGESVGQELLRVLPGLLLGIFA